MQTSFQYFIMHLFNYFSCGFPWSYNSSFRRDTFFLSGFDTSVAVTYSLVAFSPVFYLRVGEMYVFKWGRSCATLFSAVLVFLPSIFSCSEFYSCMSSSFPSTSWQLFPCTTSFDICKSPWRGPSVLIRMTFGVYFLFQELVSVGIVIQPVD